MRAIARFLLLPGLIVTSIGVAPSAATAGAQHAMRFDLVRDAVRPGIIGPDSGLTPAQLQAAYGLATAAGSRGTGERVYVDVAFHDANLASDLAVYRSQFGLPACTVASGCLKELNSNGQASPLPAGDASWATETMLQVDMVSAICPNCGITVMEAGSDEDNSLYDGIKSATTLGAKFVSIPWGGTEFASETTYDTTYFKPTGVVYAAEAGDSGFGSGFTNYPASSPDAVSVGGTTLTAASGSSRGYTETAWDDTTSECSGDEQNQPSWQASVVPSSACIHRADNDIAAVADPATGVSVYDTIGASGWSPVGGTSVSTPIIAATFALAGTPAPSEHPAALLYQRGADLNDVTSGVETGCTTHGLICQAATGWDGPTGMGTPNGLTAFLPPVDVTSLSTGSSSSITAGRSVTLTSTLTDTTAHQPVAGAAVQLLQEPAGQHSFTRVSTVTTSSAGKVSRSVSPATTTSYEWKYAGTSTTAATTSKPQTVTVASALTIGAKVHHHKAKLFGTVTPGHKGELVTLQKKVGTHWKKIATTRLANQLLPGAKHKKLSYLTSVKVSKKITVRAVVAKTATNTAGRSRSIKVK